jgi:hypothetical protein
MLLAAIALNACAPSPEVEQASNSGDGGATVTEQVSGCLADLGWEIVDAANGEAKVPPEQSSVYSADVEDCTQKVLGDVDMSPLSDAELADLYEVELEVASCLEGLGYEIDVPTLQAFIDSYHSDAPFSTYAALYGSPEAEWNSANEECPQAAEIYVR